MPDYLVRFGTMRFHGIFTWNNAKQLLKRDNYVIIRSDRGLEIAQILCEVTEEDFAQFPSDISRGMIVRKMTNDDANEFNRIHYHETEEFQTCLRCISRLGLQMHLVDIEHIFGGERIVIYYLAEGRVDFRELVRLLATEFQTRIEMRQIGVRDEAKLLADYGDCGKECCCNTYLMAMPPVSMKMAKLQKATLDPSKISGRCGRLKCCLRYEYPVYEDLLEKLPPIGANVRCEGVVAKVTGYEILAQQVYIETEDHLRKLVDVSQIAILDSERNPKVRKEVASNEENKSKGSGKSR
ncbi:MAG: regulatory iron-sulfur-containing complex subunit RicT [Planctomycetia bacterium]|nr:regulatory iron-sulfur-containing complex subunit RicT [Planctomycetia bacterium]